MRNILARSAPQSPSAADRSALRGAALLRSLLLTLYRHDPYTYRHSLRTVRLSLMLGRACALPRERLHALSLGAVAHDLGKIFVPADVLRKPGRLTPEEWDEVRRHPRAGEQLLLAAMPDTAAARVVLEHHERWDGAGYPLGLSGREIDAGARVVAVADAYDAMTGARPYRKAMTYEEAAAELARCSGTQFDPAAVDAFCRVPRGSLERLACNRQ